MIEKLKNIFLTETAAHVVKGSVGFIICVASLSTGVTNKVCGLQPQLPFWIFGTSGFIFIANSVSLICKLPQIQEKLKLLKKKKQNVGRFFDHIHGFFYSTFTIWVIPGFHWSYKSRETFEYTNHRKCEEKVQKLGATILVLLCLEVVLHFFYFVAHLFKEIKSMENITEESLEMSIISNENAKTSLAVEIVKPSNIGSTDSRRNIPRGMVTQVSRQFESEDNEVKKDKTYQKPGYSKER